MPRLLLATFNKATVLSPLGRAFYFLFDVMLSILSLGYDSISFFIFSIFLNFPPKVPDKNMKMFKITQTHRIYILFVV